MKYCWSKARVVQLLGYNCTRYMYVMCSQMYVPGTCTVCHVCGTGTCRRILQTVFEDELLSFTSRCSICVLYPLTLELVCDVCNVGGIDSSTQEASYCFELCSGNPSHLLSESHLYSLQIIYRPLATTNFRAFWAKTGFPEFQTVFGQNIDPLLCKNKNITQTMVNCSMYAMYTSC